MGSPSEDKFLRVVGTAGNACNERLAAELPMEAHSLTGRPANMPAMKPLAKLKRKVKLERLLHSQAQNGKIEKTMHSQCINWMIDTLNLYSLSNFTFYRKAS